MPQSMSAALPELLFARDVRRLRQFAPAADADGWLHPVQQAVIHRRGWLRMLAPKAAGGAELPLPYAVRLEEAIARADGSMGWVVTLCAGAGWFAGFLPPALARELIGTRRVCFAGSGAPTGHADIEGDGFRITGRWDYASGAPMGTHFTLNAMLRRDGEVLRDAAGNPRIRAFLVPAALVAPEPTWRSIGLRATASHSYRVNGQWVAKEYGFEIGAATATAQGALYRFPFYPLAYFTLSANLAGMAAHFIELARDAVARRRDPSSGAMLAELPAVRRRLSQAEQGIAQARKRFYRLLDQSWALVVEGGVLDEAATGGIKSASLELVQACRQAVDGLYPYCGLYAASELSDINRVWRDFHTATQHTLLLPLAD